MDASTMQQAERHGDDGGSCCAGPPSFCQHQHPGTMAARFIYAMLFLVGTVLAWWLRANPTEFFRIQRVNGCHGNRDCLASESVLIISMTLFLFFSVMFFTTVGTKSLHDRRNSWHSQWWLAKVVLLVVCFATSCLASARMIQLYGKVARFGAGAFLFIQLISVVRYITRLNSRSCGQQNFQTYKCKVNTVIKLAYGCSMVGILVMIWFYVGCYVNLRLVLSALMLVYLMPIISLFNKANKGFLMEPAILGVYIVFLYWSAIKSEPETSCYRKQKTGSGANWITIVSFVAGLISVAIATFSTGTDYKCLQFSNAVMSGNDVPYGYGFFHFVFATGSMFFGMTFLGWETHHVSEEWSLDVGWTSTVVHLVNAGLVVIFFGAISIARRYEIGWLHQLLGEIFGIGGQQQLPDESHGDIELTRSGVDNNGQPREESPTTEHDEGADIVDGGGGEPPQDQQLSLTTEREGTSTENNGGAGLVDPVGTERDNSESPSPSTMAGPLVPKSEPQAPVSGGQSEIEEEW